MSLILIRQKARQLETQARRQMFGAVTVPLVVAFFYVFCLRHFPQLRTLVHSLFAIALTWSLAGLYLLLRRKWPQPMPAEAGFSTGLEFCRQELTRQRNHFRRALTWSLGPVVLAMGTVILALAIVAGGQITSTAMPFVILAAAWVIAYVALWARQRNGLRREIDELNEIERGDIR